MVVGMPKSTPRRLVLAAVVAALVAMPLSGCSADAKPSPSPSASAGETTPIFASDEEALAAAVAAYEAYLDVAQQIGEDGGEDAGRIREAVTDEYAEEEIPNYESLAENKYRVVGRGTLESPSLAERTNDAVHIYGCVSVGTSRVVDSDGQDVTPPNRPTTVPLELTFQQIGDDLLLAGSDLWPGDDFC
jgi:hypothetical protein